ncbi:right-handed parallel beta-helix repeat-containing protein [Hyphomonas sp. WL0036]|uniref:parallel beta-helix domain-containing protein n=1 Tax=Hyphomonas sediminis TaxID=2866160 RepID=UPI001C7EC452|nr:parallel beta-helix domain-containing protein [Hyphomonas sediminis]MBY9066233.1 right-handed parallel beta-helix repeat-containing protein [Hyphomonas sediminis]
MIIRLSAIAGAATLLALAGCSPKSTEPPAPGIAGLPAPISAEGDFGATLQAALIAAQPGETIMLPEGTFQLSDGLSLDVSGVTLRGAGQEKTVLDFTGQEGAGEGLLVTSDDVTLMDFGVRNTKGDGIKSKGADRIIYRYLTVEWTGGPSETNGAYGIYPVESEDVLVENVTVRGASDAGVYVGQSKNIIVRNSVAEFNVAGIEIENSMNADVYGNVARDNTGGILVFDLPDLPVTGGNSTRIFDNEIIQNNTPNFAPAGNIVASVPSGTGVIVMANRNVHVFDNNFADNRSAHVLLMSYSLPITDETYNPLPRDIVLKGNTYGAGGNDPQGDLAPLAAALGGQLPPVVWDGVTAWGEGEAQTLNIAVNEAPEVGFISLGIGRYPIDPAAIAPSPERPVAEAAAEPAAVVLAHSDR